MFASFWVIGAIRLAVARYTPTAATAPQAVMIWGRMAVIMFFRLCVFVAVWYTTTNMSFEDIFYNIVSYTTRYKHYAHTYNTRNYNKKLMEKNRLKIGEANPFSLTCNRNSGTSTVRALRFPPKTSPQ